jgi:hypothetical protein
MTVWPVAGRQQRRVVASASRMPVPHPGDYSTSAWGLRLCRAVGGAACCRARSLSGAAGLWSSVSAGSCGHGRTVLSLVTDSGIGGDQFVRLHPSMTPAPSGSGEIVLQGENGVCLLVLLVTHIANTRIRAALHNAS